MVLKSLFALSLLTISASNVSAIIHPLRLSLCEIEYQSGEKLMTISLKLFLTDVNEAIVFDPNSKELAFCEPNESPNAEPLLIDYLDKFFFVKANGQLLDLKIKSKKLSGEGENTALWLYLEYRQDQPLTSLEIKNAVFTDLFFDQNNIVYVHIDDESKSMMLNKKTPTHLLKFCYAPF